MHVEDNLFELANHVVAAILLPFKASGGKAPLPPAAVSPSAASMSVSALSASTMPTSVESKSDNDPKTVRFTNVQDLFDVINSITGDFLTVTRLYMRYYSQLVRNDREDIWEDIGTTTFRQEGHPRGDGGEGDSTGGPWPERAGVGKWPTLVIEAGDPQTLDGLHNDMRWRFRTSNHEVKIVILAKFDRRQYHILLEKWEEEISRPQGAITCRRAAAMLQQGGILEPVKRQSITITRDETTNPVSYNVTRGALVLGFRLLFLRDPSPQEGDFVLNIQNLRRYAERVWAQVPGPSRFPHGTKIRV
ncbi:hypothetical protein B0H67DRAFT_663063 [Lasiosphaeris hirsuta]|uniref:Uncharacterized protein n=1 Tax=Lasiosphaeris hirsuta TaxID=260670 RepID=A0AA40E1B4_9PEZI|nr:hypothetical protein B0H67DRAFT_663063 [Lasiosphaeris hirsuta]